MPYPNDSDDNPGGGRKRIRMSDLRVPKEPLMLNPPRGAMLCALGAIHFVLFASFFILGSDARWISAFVWVALLVPASRLFEIWCAYGYSAFTLIVPSVLLGVGEYFLAEWLFRVLIPM